MGLRDLAQDLAPPWLLDDSPGTPDNPTGGVGGRFTYLLGLMGDALLDKMQQAIYARLPLGGTSSPSGGNGGPDDDALGLIGADRVIVRGIGEPALAFGQRLQRAFPTWQHSGQAITVMTEVLAYLQTKCKIMVVADVQVSTTLIGSNPGGYGTLFAAGADTTLPPARWTVPWWWDTGFGFHFISGRANAYDGHPYLWPTPIWRDWLVLWSVAPNAWTGDEGSWGDDGNYGDDSASWGLSVTSTVITTLRSIVGTFKCANTWYRWVIVSLDANFADWSSGSAYYPSTGDWQHWSKIATAVNPDGLTVPAHVQARAPNLRYCDGVIDPPT